MLAGLAFFLDGFPDQLVKQRESGGVEGELFQLAVAWGFEEMVQNFGYRRLRDTPPTLFLLEGIFSEKKYPFVGIVVETAGAGGGEGDLPEGGEVGKGQAVPEVEGSQGTVGGRENVIAAGSSDFGSSIFLGNGGIDGFLQEEFPAPLSVGCDLLVDFGADMSPAYALVVAAVGYLIDGKITAVEGVVAEGYAVEAADVIATEEVELAVGDGGGVERGRYQRAQGSESTGERTGGGHNRIRAGSVHTISRAVVSENTDVGWELLPADVNEGSVKPAVVLGDEEMIRGMQHAVDAGTVALAGGGVLFLVEGRRDDGPGISTVIGEVEAVPAGAGDAVLGVHEVELNELIEDHSEAYLDKEVRPHVGEAWIDYSRTKVGYENPINRHFYVYDPPRPLAKIEADMTKVEEEILGLLKGL
jgi:hypothetical protein